MIFNSLGSNYNFGFVLKSLFAFGGEGNKMDLVNFLSIKYDGEPVLLYKCREAIKLTLDMLKLPNGSKVGITGFTCYAVYKAVVDAGCLPEYIDIEKDTLNFSLSEVRKHGKIKVLIIQNTLGNPCDIEGIKKYCLENKIILIEDLAHSIGSMYGNGIETGLCGDFTVLSFGQDKIIDAISGGALIIRNNKYKNKIDTSIFKSVDIKKQIKDRFYPLLTFLIRTTYGIGLGKLLHFLFKKLNMLSQPIVQEDAIVMHNLPNWYCGLVNFQFTELENNLVHRHKMVSAYLNNKSKIDNSFSLRFPILVKNRKDLINDLKEAGIYISDIWYDAPIAPAKFLKLTDYTTGQCKISEEVSDQIINLPTHINMSVSEARLLSNKINKWQNTQ